MPPRPLPARMVALVRQLLRVLQCIITTASSARREATSQEFVGISGPLRLIGNERELSFFHVSQVDLAIAKATTFAEAAQIFVRSVLRALSGPRCLSLVAAAPMYALSDLAALAVPCFMGV